MEGLRLPKQKLKELGVGLVYLFGSQAEELETPLSDIDIGIVFLNHSGFEDASRRKKIYSQLLDLFAQLYLPTFDKNLDIVFLEQTPISLQFSVICEGKLLYEFSPEFRANYEERVVDEYLDFVPIISYFEQVFYERLG